MVVKVPHQYKDSERDGPESIVTTVAANGVDVRIRRPNRSNIEIFSRDKFEQRFKEPELVFIDNSEELQERLRVEALKLERDELLALNRDMAIALNDVASIIGIAKLTNGIEMDKNPFEFAWDSLEELIGKFGDETNLNLLKKIRDHVSEEVEVKSFSVATAISIMNTSKSKALRNVPSSYTKELLLKDHGDDYNLNPFFRKAIDQIAHYGMTPEAVSNTVAELSKAIKPYGC